MIEGVVENMFENVSPEQKAEIRKVLIEKGKEIISENEDFLNHLNSVTEQIGKHPEFRRKTILELNTLKTNFISYGDTERALKCQELINSCEADLNNGRTESLISSLDEKADRVKKIIDEAKNLVSALESN